MKLRRGTRIQLTLNPNARGIIEPPIGKRGIFVDTDRQIVHVRFDDDRRANIFVDLITIVKRRSK